MPEKENKIIYDSSMISPGIWRNVIKQEFISTGWLYLHSIAGEHFCGDGSCLECRLTDILLEVQKKK